MNLKYVGRLGLDENGSYFKHRLGGKIRGKTMLEIFKEITKPPEYCHVCINNEGQILVLPPTDKLHTEPDEDWNEFTRRFNLLASGSIIRGFTWRNTCSGVYI